MPAPITIRIGSVRVKIYPSLYRGKMRYEVRDHFGGGTNRKKFTRKAAALLYANEQAAQMASGTTARFRLDDRQAFLAEEAIELLEREGITKDILQVAHEYVDGYKIATRQRLSDSPLVSAVVEEFLREKTRQQLSGYHLRDLKVRLGRFAADFCLPINRILRPELEAWLRELNVGGRTFNNYRAVLASLFHFARERKFLPPEWSEFDGLKRIKLQRRKVIIFKPETFADLLSGATNRLLPALVVSGFAGLRSEEVLRLDWSAFKWAKKFIYLREEITKTNVTRCVPITAVLAEWLKPWQHLTSGAVCDYSNLSEGKRNLARRLGHKWPRNGLRDSFISYRLAETQNIAQVALEAGTSPLMIHRHYLELSIPEEAAKWFAIRPKSVTTNVLELQFGQ